VGDGPLTLFIAGDRRHYRLGYHDAAGDHECAQGEVRYLCTETAGGYNGVMLGLFATAHGSTTANHARFAWADYLPRSS
jgi:alpha-N-arabinofuranosidase